MRTKKIFSKTFRLTLALIVGAPLIFSAAVILAAAGTPQAARAQASSQNITPANFTPQVMVPRSAIEEELRARTAAGLEGVPVGKYNSQTGVMTSDLLAKYIKAFYDYGLAAAGILAAIVLMAGGLLWLTSGGNDTKIGQAKELIAGSITGSLILFSSWIILNTISPELLQLRTISTKVAPTLYMNIGCCKSNTDGTAFGGAQSDCGAGHTFFANQMYDPVSRSCAPAGCCVFDKVSKEAAKAVGKNLSECSQSTQAGCQAPNGGSAFKNQSCSSLPECQGALLFGCEDQNDGTACGSSGFGFCYDKTCLIGTTGTKVGDQCGSDKGAVCQKNYFNPRSIVPRCPNPGEVDSRNWVGSSGGRDCASGLSCCRPAQISNCAWALNNQCSDISKVAGPDSSCAGTKPNADTAKCCCSSE